MKVLTPVTWYSAGAATRAKPPIIAPFDHEVHLAHRRGRALALQDLEVVAVVGLVAVAVALGDDPGDPLAHRPLPRSVGALPRQAVLLAGGADDALRVLIHRERLALLEGVLVLRLDVAAADLDGVELVAADPTVQDLVPAGRGVEAPLALSA